MAETGGVFHSQFNGLSEFGRVTRVASGTVFFATLTGYGDNYFQDWDCYVVRKGLGTGAAHRVIRFR